MSTREASDALSRGCDLASMKFGMAQKRFMAIDCLRKIVSTLISRLAPLRTGRALDGQTSGVEFEPGIQPYVEDVVGSRGACGCTTLGAGLRVSSLGWQERDVR
jgi:hypothetical protein